MLRFVWKPGGRAVSCHPWLEGVAMVKFHYHSCSVCSLSSRDWRIVILLSIYALYEDCELFESDLGCRKGHDDSAANVVPLKALPDSSVKSSY